MSWDKLRSYARGRTIDTGAETPSEEHAMPTVNGKTVSYPFDLTVPAKSRRYSTVDPYEHLGPIGYTTNTWRNKEGPLKIYTNLYLGFSMKPSARREDARRLILAESIGGLQKNIDEDSYVSKAQYHYLDNKGPDRTQNMVKHRRKNPAQYMFKA